MDGLACKMPSAALVIVFEAGLPGERSGALRALRETALTCLSLLCLLLLLPMVGAQSGPPSPHSFVYQGRITDDNKAPADGAAYDLLFTLWDASSNGTSLGAPLTLAPVAVYGGVFVVNLDFGPGVFNGSTRWLQTAVRPYTTTLPLPSRQVLDPRQPLTYTPQALYALTVADGAVTAAKISGLLDPANIPNLDAAKISTGVLADDRLGGGIARAGDVTTLAAQVAALSASVANLIAGGGPTTPAGVTYVSADPADPDLVVRGLRVVVRVPAPPWANGATVQSPSARYGHSGVWTGQEWILWGGILGRDANGANLYASTGGRYHPDSDLWTAVSTESPPAARSRHTAVWSGSEMIVWGGYGGTDFLADGGRFSVSNNRWSGLSASPLAVRDGHGAVWTGDRMLVWGGNNRTGRRADGALYNPVDNTWTLLPTAGAPAGRANATVLWAGDRLLVWGGDGADGYLADGAQLLFTGGVPAGTWQSVTAAGAPAARSGHTAVWTGTQMLVWGGENGQGKLGDGAAYDPLANAWTSLSAASAPVARKLHSAIWTGAEMIVYGGATATGTTSTGAVYNPALNRWRALTNPGTPAARQAATAVWTGSQALFFGGANSNGTLLAALQRLDPQPAWYFFRKP